MDDLSQFKEGFILESNELMSDMESRLLRLQPGSKDLTELNAIFRCAHSIKGGAGAFGFEQITKFTHVLEALLEKLRSQELEVTEEIINALIKSVDIVNQMIAAVSNNTTMPAEFGNDIKQELERLTNQSQAPLQKEQNTEISIQDLEQITNNDDQKIYEILFKTKNSFFLTGNDPLLLIRELSGLGWLQTEVMLNELPTKDFNPELSYLSWKFILESKYSYNRIREVFEFVEGECDLIIKLLAGEQNTKFDESKEDAKLTEQNAINLADKTSSNNSKHQVQTKHNNLAVTSIRVDIGKIDKLVNIVGELVITQSMLFSQSIKLSRDDYPELFSGIEDLSQHSRELQEAVLSVRMQAVKSIFSRMPRLVHDLTHQLGKNVIIEMTGENTEVDKTVIEQLSDPLTHMIRNAVDHGIEKPEVRIEAGKNPQGIIKLSAYHRGGKIVIELEDDGAGINTEKLLKKAIEKNLVEPNVSLSMKELYNLIFHPGLSTAEKVTDISGRGVGMDVVKKNIEGIGGTIDIDSKLGKGSKFVISLPLTLAILDGMIVKVGKEHYIIPIVSIIETLRPKAEEVRMLVDHNDVINVRGEFVSLVYLGQVFNIKDYERDPSKSLVVLVENGTTKFGIVVDELIGQQQVVIKSLEINSDPIDGISGATILGDGKVSLILDIMKLHSNNINVEKKEIQPTSNLN